MKYILTLFKEKQAFFMPTVVCFLIFLFSFIIFQVYQITDYQIIVKNQEHAIGLSNIQHQIKQFVQANLKKQTPKYCIVPTVYINKTFGGSDIKIKRTCLRQETNNPIVNIAPETKIINKLYKLIKLGPNEISKPNILTKKGFIFALTAIQVNHEWVGLPADLESLEPQELAKLTALQSVPFYYFYQVDFTFNNTNYNMLIVGNEENNTLDYFFFT